MLSRCAPHVMYLGSQWQVTKLSRLTFFLLPMLSDCILASSAHTSTPWIQIYQASAHNNCFMQRNKFLNAMEPCASEICQSTGVSSLWVHNSQRMAWLLPSLVNTVWWSEVMLSLQLRIFDKTDETEVMTKWRLWQYLSVRQQMYWLRLNEGRKKLGRQGIGTLEDVEIIHDDKFIRCGDSKRQKNF